MAATRTRLRAAATRLAGNDDGPMRALLVEHGSSRGGLAAARDLHRAGWTVDVVASGEGLTMNSRSVRRRMAVRYPHDGPEALLDAVQRAIRGCGTHIVLPTDETQLLVLSRHREELGALLPYPPHDVVQRATDRLEQARIAEAVGLAPPRTQPSTAAQVSGLGGLVVVKACTPGLVPGPGGWGRVETRVGTPHEADGWIADLEDAGVPAVVQEVVTGDLASMTVLTDARGELIGQVQQAASRLWPPGAGTSARATTVPVDPELTRRVVAFLDALGWRGFAQLQFIVDADGFAHLIDFNPRFYGSLALAIGSGVSFPILWAASATGRPLSNGRPARVGVRYQWLGGDARRALRERRGGVLRDLGASVAWGLPAVHPIWSMRDPKPAIRSWLRLARRLL